MKKGVKEDEEEGENGKDEKGGYRRMRRIRGRKEEERQ